MAGVGVQGEAGLPDGGDPRIQGIGVFGSGRFGGTGVVGFSDAGAGVAGVSESGTAGSFQNTPSGSVTNDNPALDVGTTGTGSAGFFHIDNPASDANTLISVARHGTALLGLSGSGPGLIAGGTSNTLIGDVTVFGTLDATAKNFVIDHPLDPANKTLSHTSVESAERINIYSGNVILDADGQATVRLGPWVEAVNDDIRYQLTCIGVPAPVYISRQFADGQFTIAGGVPEQKISWQLIGVRADPWTQAHPLTVEQDKPDPEKRHYRHPELYAHGPDRNLQLARTPQLIELTRQASA